MKRELFNQVTFREQDHSYITNSGDKLLSTTTLVSKFKPKFDPGGFILRACAKKEGISPEEMKIRWEEKGLQSRIKGTSVHKAIEDITYTNWIEIEDKPYALEAYKWAIKTKLKFLNKFSPCRLLTELLVYCLEFGIAGQIDLVHIREDGSVDIFDYKTSKTIDLTSKYNNKMLHPIAHLEDCNYIHYSLQLLIYAYMLEAKGITVHSMTIIHLNEESDELEFHKVEKNDSLVATVLNAPNFNFNNF